MTHPAQCKRFKRGQRVVTRWATGRLEDATIVRHYNEREIARSNYPRLHEWVIVRYADGSEMACHADSIA